jgi:hypothetical protein
LGNQDPTLMHDNSLQQRTQSKLQILSDIIAAHCSLLADNNYLPHDYVTHFEQHLDLTLINFSTYTALQRATLNPPDVNQTVTAYPVSVSHREQNSSSIIPLPPSPFTNHRGKYSFYAVRKGRVCGIYRSWLECSVQVTGFSGSEFKGFYDLTSAQNYLQ